MKSNFKYIVAGIITCLCLVFILQVFWLKGLYGSIENESEKLVMECMEIANMDELQFRIDSLEREPKQGKTITISQSINDGEDEKDETKKATERKQVIKDNDTTTTVRQSESSGLDVRQMEQITRLFRETLHQALDSIAIINIAVIDSSLTSSFIEKDIKSRLYKIEIVDFKTNKIIDQQNIDTLYSSSQTFSFMYDSENQMGYRIYIEPLTKTVLLQMAGILATTALIVIILGFAFWYLIRTVMRQKTLEEMKDDFTNNMTHELKTPIAVAYSAADALLNYKQGDNKEKRDKYLTICKDQLSTLGGLVEQILSMSMERRQKFVLNKEDIQMGDMINNMIIHHKLKANKSVEFNVTINPEDMIINADRTHLNNIISNLIDNAIKYSGESVTIDINIQQTNKYNIIEVRDNGIGIPPEKQPYIFDKFYRVTQGNKYTVKGYGLGLFYVKTMIDKHNGIISVSNNKENGSVFTIKLPL